MKVDQSLVDAAIAFVDHRFPDTPYAGAAAVYAGAGAIHVSTALEVLNDAVALCHEVGAMCAAYAHDQAVTATVCVSRDPKAGMIIIPPCGVCQERLWYWGGDVDVALPVPGAPTTWRSRALREISPHYWRNALPG